MTIQLLGVISALALCAGALAQESGGPVAQWTFDEDHGELVRDSGKNEVHGHVYGAKWVECGEGYALTFETDGAFVDCGTVPCLDITGPMSLEAWVYPTQRATSETGIAGKSFDSYAFTLYGDGCYYWYISSGANKCKAPAKVSYWSHLVGTFDGKTLKLYVNGELADSFESQYDAVNSGGDFFIGRIARSTGGGPTDTFKGVIDSVRVYDRALSHEEIRTRYAEERSGYRRMEQGLDRVILSPFYYFEKGEMLVDVDFGTLFPFRENESAEVTLWRKGSEEPLQRLPVADVPESGILRDLEIDVRDITPGEYEIRATFAGKDGLRREDKAAFVYPPRLEAPSPDEQTAPPLPAAAEPVAYNLEISEGGGLSISLGDDTYDVESFYSYPHGGENGLTVITQTSCESSWRVAVEKLDDATHQVRVGGEFYTIDRRVLRRPNHVLVKDTIANTSGEPVGIILSNQVDSSRVGGIACRQPPNPTVFLFKENQGVGIVALDDVYLEQHETFFEKGVGGIRSRRFALEAGASYTLEWAVYVNGTGDYYDFINAVRKDEGLIRTVEGCFAFMDRREAPSQDWVDMRSLKYASVACLSYSADDKGLSIEGIEFTEYPEECALLKATFAETRKRHPDLDVMFHVAHSLYATHKPDELFPDSRTLDASGKQTDYGGNNVAYYQRYFSKEHVEEGYRWFIFYPAKDNSFGKAMLEATDFMLDEIGVTGMFADGFTHGYGGRFTYDRWDGHTAEIDPETKTIKRKFASVNLLADPILIEVVRKINDRGGVVIANSYPGTRTFNRENVIYCIETGGGDKSLAHLHLAPTVIGLGDPGHIECERDVYDDIRAKLEWGALYFYYGEKGITRQTVTTQMYPITVEEFRPGILRGRERIVTTRSGVYGWPGERELHLAYRYDGRGVLAAHDFLTTVDGESVRTHLALKDGETAVLKKIPVALEADSPVNLIAEQYDKKTIRLALNGTGAVRLTISDGQFPVKPGTDYSVKAGETDSTIRVEGDRLVIQVDLDGQTQLEVIESLRD